MNVKQLKHILNRFHDDATVKVLRETDLNLRGSIDAVEPQVANMKGVVVIAPRDLEGNSVSEIGAISEPEE